MVPNQAATKRSMIPQQLQPPCSAQHRCDAGHNMLRAQPVRAARRSAPLPFRAKTQKTEARHPKNMLNSHMQELAKALGGPPPSPEKDGSFILYFEGGHKVQCFERHSTIFITARVCRLPEQQHKSARLCKTLLQNSLGRMKDSRAVLSVDNEKESVRLHLRYEPENRHNPAFSSAVGDFLNILEAYKLLTQDRKQTTAPNPGIIIRP